jgi:hypothetical protein
MLRLPRHNAVRSEGKKMGGKGAGGGLFETSRALSANPLRLFVIDEVGWLEAPKLEGYTPRKSRRTPALREALFTYVDAL